MSIEIPAQLAQAVWAAMHDDDDLAEDYVAISIVHGLNHLVQDMGAEPFSADEWRRIVRNLREARTMLDAVQDDLASRWSAYNEPPF